MFSIGSSRAPASVLTPNKDHLASTRQLSNMPYSNNLVYNQSKQFPDFKFNQIDDTQPIPAATAMKVHKFHPPHKKSPSKTLKKNISMMDDIDEVGLDASLNEEVYQTPEASASFSTCPLKIKLTNFLTSSFGCSPQKNSISPSNTASPKSSSTSPIEFLNFTWFATPTSKIPCAFRKRLSSDCQSEDSFVIFANDGDNLDSDCFTNDEDDDDEDDDDEDDDTDDEESCGEMCHDMGHMDDMVDKEVTKKKVSFQSGDKLCTVHRMLTWSFAYCSARKGHWEELGRDRTRFKDRIDNIAPTINKILSPDHRNTVFKQRFVE